MTEAEQMQDVFLLCHRLKRESQNPHVRAAAESVLARGADALPQLITAAQGTAHENELLTVTWSAWNRR